MNANTLSRTVQEALLSEAMGRAQTLAAPYQALVAEIAAASDAIKAHQEGQRKETVRLWDAFKRSLSIATEQGHNSQSLRVGLELACDAAKVPSGSFRGYITTLINLHDDVQARKLTLADALALSIGDARKRYRKTTPEEQARARLNEALRRWSPEEIATLADVVAGEADVQQAQEIVEIAQVHAEEAKQEEEAANNDQ